MPKRSKKHTEALKKVDKETRYDPKDALELTVASSYVKFDETVDVAVRLGVDPRHADQMVRGTVILPNGLGRDVKVLVFAKGEKETEALNAGADFIINDELIEKILNLKDSDNPYEQAIYLQFVSGRRINEVYSAPLRINNKQPLEVAMKLSKKNGDDKAKYHKFNLLQNTINNKQFKQKITKLRSSVNGVSLQDFTNRVNRKVKQIIDKDLSSHDLRGLYAVYGFHTQNDDDTNLLGYINKVLNHGDTSIDSSQSYSNFKYIK